MPSRLVNSVVKGMFTLVDNENLKYQKKKKNTNDQSKQNLVGLKNLEK